MGEKFGENELAIVNEISKDPRTTISQLNQIVGISTTAIGNNITKLKEKGILKRIGPDKGGYWEVNLRNKEFNSLE